jgi:hypothetical protein
LKITDIKVHALKPFGAINNIAGWEKKKNVFSYIQVLTDEGIEGCSISSLTGGNPAALENSLNIAEYITSGAVDIIRSFGDHIGGITPMMKAAHLCEAHNIKNELHSFGPTLVEAAHLHVMLSIRNCDFFEAADPEGLFTAGMKDSIKVAPDGYVYAPQKPGLGYDVDWDYISDHTEKVF